MKTVFSYLLVIVITSFLSISLYQAYLNSKNLSIQNASTQNLDPYKIYNLINDYRASKRLNKLVFDPSMCDFTEKRLSEIHTDYSHTGFLPDVKSAYIYTYAGENLAKGYISEQDTITDWIHSPEHLKNIINPHYTKTCIESDTYDNSSYISTYVVQEFASY